MTNPKEHIVLLCVCSTMEEMFLLLPLRCDERNMKQVSSWDYARNNSRSY